MAGVETKTSGESQPDVETKTTTMSSSAPRPSAAEDPSGKSAIELDVGGMLFKTRREVLRSFPDSVLASIADCVGVHGPVFIDRDGTHFRYILNYLRDKGKCVLPPTVRELREIEQEANYYCLHGLAAAVQQALIDQAQYEAAAYRRLNAHEFGKCGYCGKELHIPSHKDQRCLRNKGVSDYHPGKLVFSQDNKMAWNCCGKGKEESFWGCAKAKNAELCHSFVS